MISPRILTVGHSSHPWANFISLMDAGGVGAIADVRSVPHSRFRHFNRLDLRSRLNREGIPYLFLGTELGGHAGPGENYEQMAQKPLFEDGIERVLAAAARCRIALTCAEHEPLDCHRFLLVSRELTRRGVPVGHILRDGRIEEQTETEDRLMMMMLGASADLVEPRCERLARAYEKREAKLRQGKRTRRSALGGSS